MGNVCGSSTPGTRKMHHNKHGEYTESEGILYDAVYRRDLAQVVDLLDRYPEMQLGRYRHPKVRADPYTITRTHVAGRLT